jgi:hypothetical protein
MKALSINAQEFVPISWLNQQQQQQQNIKINQQTSPQQINNNPYRQNYTMQQYQPLK